MGQDKPGRPPLPTRLMAGLAILKHTYDLSDEVLCELGKGGQGRTLLVEREGEPGSRYVLKLLRLEHVDERSRRIAVEAAIFRPAQITRPMQCTSSSPQSGQSG